MNHSTPIAVFMWLYCLWPCQARVQVEVSNAILDVDAWIDRTRKSNALSPLTTEMLYAVLALLSPCERTATKVKAWTGFVNRTI